MKQIRNKRTSLAFGISYQAPNISAITALATLSEGSPVRILPGYKTDEVAEPQTVAALLLRKHRASLSRELLSLQARASRRRLSSAEAQTIINHFKGAA